MKLSILQKYFSFFIIFFAAIFALYQFQTIPGFWFDEGIIAQAAKNIALHGIYGIQMAPGVFDRLNFWITTGFPLIFPVAFFLKLFGVSVWAARIAPLLYLLGFVFLSYFFIKKMYGFEAAAWASLLLITFNPLYGNGKAVLGEIPGLFWFVAGLLLYMSYSENRQTKKLIGVAAAWGLCVATKPYYVLIVPSVIFLTSSLWIGRGKFDRRNFLIFGSSFAFPVLLWAFFSFDFSSFQNLRATLLYFLNSYGAESFAPLANLFRFVSESTPIHFAVLNVAVFFGWFAVRRQKTQALSVLTAVLIFVGLSFLWYLKTPGWYRYFFSIHVLVILFFPFAVLAIARHIGRALRRDRIGEVFGRTILAALFGFQVAFLIFNYRHFSGEDAMKLQRYFEPILQGDTSVFVVSQPEAAFLLDDRNLYQSIFINENFEIGKNIIKAFPTDYLVMGRPSDQFFSENKQIVEYNYAQEKVIGPYIIYRRR